MRASAAEGGHVLAAGRLAPEKASAPDVIAAALREVYGGCPPRNFRVAAVLSSR
jgi:hypothetical protein